ncbi:MAG: Hsp20/alpha crystallin family protein [Pseudomonadota bacterium]
MNQENMNQGTQAGRMGGNGSQQHGLHSEAPDRDLRGNGGAGGDGDTTRGSDLARQGGEGSLSRSQGSTGRSEAVLPPVDIFEDEHNVTILADLPGVSREGLGVRVDGDSLVIEGTASSPETGDMELIYGEVLNPMFRRSFTLSRDLNPGNIEASLNHGVLKLVIPKAEEAKPRRIDVRVG